MSIYLILYHNNNLVLSNLIKLLGGHVYIHPCKSIKKINYQIIESYNQNVKITRKRFYGNWGGFGIVEATIEGIRQILGENPNCTHISLLSGSDFPIKPIRDYEKYLSLKENKSFIHHWDFYPFDLVKNNKNPWYGSMHIQKLRITKYYFDAFQRRYSVPPLSNDGYFEFQNSKNKIKHFLKTKGMGFTNNIKKETFQLKKSFLLDFPRKSPLKRIYGASQWWTLSKKHCEYLLEFHDNNFKVRNFFKHSMLPDETYIQSILLNSKYAHEIENNNLRHITFPEGSSHPKTLMLEDLNELLESQSYFARKFDESKSKTLMEYFEKNIL